MNKFDNVQDSSIWIKPSSFSAVTSTDNRLFIGVVREVRNLQDTNELRYMVEVYHKTDTVLTSCRMLRSFGGVYNYEDFVMRGYNYNNASNNQNGSVAIAGDVVLVGQFGGQGREGIIIGSLTHPARKSFLDASKGPQYKQEFNGIETSINPDGEWTLTFKGQPTNLNNLSNTPSQPISEPQYDTKVGTSYMKWDKTGSFTVDDNATENKQRIFIDKKNGALEIDSGKISLKLTKNDQLTFLTTKTLTVKADKIQLGDDGLTEWLILGSTFRQNQNNMHKSLITYLNAAATAFSVLSPLIQALSVQPTPSPGAPLAPTMASASIAIDQAQAALTQAAQAIQLFESQGSATNYLSQISKTK